jgi:hypothetical protein
VLNSDCVLCLKLLLVTMIMRLFCLIFLTFEVYGWIDKGAKRYSASIPILVNKLQDLNLGESVFPQLLDNIEPAKISNILCATTLPYILHQNLKVIYPSIRSKIKTLNIKPCLQNLCDGFMQFLSLKIDAEIDLKRWNICSLHSEEALPGGYLRYRFKLENALRDKINLANGQEVREEFITFTSNIFYA